MWRTCYYNSSQSTITEYTWDDEGERIELTTPFKPFLMLESGGETNFKSIYNTSLYRKDFQNSYKRYQFLQEYDGRTFFNLPPEQQYLIGKYRKTERSDFMKNDIRIFFLDIEAPAKSEFPRPEEANYEIDLMTIYDSLTKKYHMWGKHGYTANNLDKLMDKMAGEKSKFIKVTKDDIVYHEFFDEAERLDDMLKFWEENCPDVYTGWNIDGFDTPYIVNRVRKVVGTKDHLRLSPVKKVSHRDTFDKFGNPRVEYKIVGVNCMDYMDVYKTFTFNAEKPSWKLDDIAQSELKCGKVEFNQGSLYELAQQDWETYNDYNLVDVALIVSLEAKTTFIEIGRQTAYEGYSNITDCLGKIVTITGSIAKSALDKGLVIETRKAEENQTFEGGYVKQPDTGIKTNIVTYDVTSLYPTNMMALGVSHETKVGKVIEKHDGYVVFTEYGKTIRKREDEFKEYLTSKNYCISCAEVIFDQNKDGVVNDFVTTQFNNKSTYKKLEREAKANGDIEKSKEYYRLGQITKIFLNSCYGVISASSSPLFDLDIARSITLTGQFAIKKAAELANEFSTEKFNVKDEVVIGGDTDSIFCDFTEITVNTKQSMFVEDGISEFGTKICRIFEIVLNNGVNEWAKEYMLCNNPTFNFEREKAAETALFFGKKQYAYYVKNNDGDDLPEEERMKYTGLKVIKSEYSEMVKGMMNELYHETLSSYLTLGHADCRKHINDIIKKHKEQFYKASFFDVSKRQKANNTLKWENEFVDRYKQGASCPIQTKSVILYNRLRDDHELGGKFPPIESGAKAMWVYLETPNIYDITSVAGIDGILPEEFGLKVNYDEQWAKLYLRVAYQLYETIQWSFPNIHHDELVDLDELFT